MSLTAILLLFFSACTHAGWNLLSKRTAPTSSFFLLANTAGIFLLLPTLIYYPLAAHAFTPIIWILLCVTGFFQALYYIALGNAYQRGDLSLVYPLARSSPILVVTASTFFLGRGDQISTLCIWGILLVLAGCFVLPMRLFRDFRVDNYLNLSSFFALLAALGTAGYSLIDDEALRLLRNQSNTELSTWQITLLYALLEAGTSSLWLAIFALPFQSCRAQISHLLNTQKKAIFMTSAGIYLTYGLVLISMAFVTNVSYVVGFRQLSIPIGAILGVIYLKEPGYIPKFAGIAILVIGLLLIALG